MRTRNYKEKIEFKSRYMQKNRSSETEGAGLMPCPFCGGEVQMIIGMAGIPMLVCRKHDCHATVSFRAAAQWLIPARLL
jgi:hypothetical protein|nr:MAG TPA: restriction alleviation protein [Caudoviricetes sp.]